MEGDREVAQTGLTGTTTINITRDGNWLAMALELEFSVTIDRPIEDVFDYVTDHENDEEWKSIVVNAPPTDEEVGEGTTWELEVKMWGMTSVLENECTVYERPTKFAYKNGGSVATENLYTFEKTNSGTLMTWEGTTEFKGVMRLLKPILARSMANEIKENQFRLKEILEESTANEGPDGN